jgi:predicted GIY-YIG superfamily endonuclease
VLHPDQIIAVYIMASGRNGTLYTGMTTDLSRRIYEHRERVRDGFTKRYGCTRLVWWERFELITPPSPASGLSRATPEPGSST